MMVILWLSFKSLSAPSAHPPLFHTVQFTSLSGHQLLSQTYPHGSTWSTTCLFSGLWIPACSLLDLFAGVLHCICLLSVSCWGWHWFGGNRQDFDNLKDHLVAVSEVGMSKRVVVECHGRKDSNGHCWSGVGDLCIRVVREQWRENGPTY